MPLTMKERRKQKNGRQKNEDGLPNVRIILLIRPGIQQLFKFLHLYITCCARNIAHTSDVIRIKLVGCSKYCGYCSSHNKKIL